MKRQRHTEEQIIQVLQEAAAGAKTLKPASENGGGHRLDVTELPPERKMDFSDTETQGFRIAGTVPGSQDFDRLARLVDVVIDQVMIPQHFAGTRTLFDGLPNERSLTDFQGATEQFIADA